MKHCPECLRWVVPDTVRGRSTSYGRIPDWSYCSYCGWLLSPPEQVSA